MTLEVEDGGGGDGGGDGVKAVNQKLENTM